MELKEFYDGIKNPLLKDKTIERIVYAYAESYFPNHFYSNLVVQPKYSDKDPNKRLDLNDRDKFYAYLFNKWKRSILSVTKEEYRELYRKGYYGQDFIKMRNFLLNVRDVSTYREAEEIFYGPKADKELEGALKKYAWSSFGRGSSWVHVSSQYLTANRDKYFDVDHRFYINLEASETYKMITYLVQKFEQFNLPFYFKFGGGTEREESVVIYCSTENLMRTLDVLREIKKEHPELISKAKNPPFLTGVVDDWIGYGSEPPQTPEGENQSFNGVRSDMLYPVVDNMTKKWMKDNINKVIVYQGKHISLYDYITLKCMEKLISNLEYNYSNRQNGSKESTKELFDYFGFTIEELRNPKFKSNIYSALRQNLYPMLTKFCNNSIDVLSKISLPVHNGKTVDFTYNMLKSSIKELAMIFVQYDPSFLQTLRGDIINECAKFGIDQDKFCFDTHAVRKMQQVYNERVKRGLVNYSKIRPVQKPVQRPIQRPIQSQNYMNYQAESYIQDMDNDITLGR